MGKLDEKCSVFFDDPARFADLMNFVLFAGRQEIRAGDLTELDSVMTGYFAKKTGKAMRVITDKTKLWKGKYLRILVQEYQSYVDYRMVLRCMKEEAAAYEKQYIRKRRKHRKRRDLEGGHEFLSGIKKDDHFIPVITLVVNMSDDPWDGARTLYEMFPEPPDDLIKDFVNDYRLNLFDYHDYDDFDSMQTDVRRIFEVFRYKKDKEKLRAITSRDTGYSDLDKDTADLIEEIVDHELVIRKDERGRRNMGNAITEIKEEGRVEGKAEDLVDIIEEFDDFDDELRDTIMAEKNIDTLRSWLKKAIRCTSAAEFKSFISTCR